jgi:glutamate synthase domain-containing protein 3
LLVAPCQSDAAPCQHQVSQEHAQKRRRDWPNITQSKFIQNDSVLNIICLENNKIEQIHAAITARSARALGAKGTPLLSTLQQNRAK